MASILQKLAREKNWLQGFRMAEIHLRYTRYLKLSPKTINYADKANYYIGKAKESMDLDWRAQRRAIKQQQEKD